MGLASVNQRLLFVLFVTFQPCNSALPSDFPAMFNSDPVWSSKKNELAAEAIGILKNTDQQFFDAGIDFMHGSSTIAMHSFFIGTKNRSVEMGIEERQRQALISRLTTRFAVPASTVAKHLDSLFFTPEVQKKRMESQCPDKQTVKCDRSSKYRTADGSCNNLRHPNWGRAFIPLRRYAKPAYDDGVSYPRTIGRNGNKLPSPRLVSRNLHSSDINIPELEFVTHMLMQWGQFLDHDITSTPIHKGSGGSTVTCCIDDIPKNVSKELITALSSRDICFSIPIPPGDHRFRDRSCLNFVRSIQVPNSDCQFEPVEQLNQLTAYIDASQVYGSSLEEQEELRASSRGLLKTSYPRLLPQVREDTCKLDVPTEVCFKAGDERVNEQMALASMHTIWLRQHNQIAHTLASLNPHWDDERLFQETRKIVGAMMQHITYHEFLPIILNDNYTTEFGLKTTNWGFDNVYSPQTDASIRNSFATASFRFGHSLLRSSMANVRQGYILSSKTLLRDMFGNISLIVDEDGKRINTFLRGLVVEKSKVVDRFISSELTDHLFEDFAGNALDLVSLNLQRGRDHGLPGYNVWREWCHLSKATNFGTGQGGLVDHSPSTAEKLREFYQHPDDIDIWSGGVSETCIDGGIVGPTIACILAHQFQALKQGDRFWFERDDATVGFTKDQVNAIKLTSLARVMCDTTDIRYIQPDAFRKVNGRNPRVSCSHLYPLNLAPWKDISFTWSPWSSWSPCRNSWSTRRRKCNGHGCRSRYQYQSNYIYCLFHMLG